MSLRHGQTVLSIAIFGQILLSHMYGLQARKYVTKLNALQNLQSFVVAFCQSRFLSEMLKEKNLHC